MRKDLGKDDASDLFRSLLSNHKKRAVDSLLPDAVLASIEEIEATQASTKNEEDKKSLNLMLSRPSFRQLKSESSELSKLEKMKGKPVTSQLKGRGGLGALDERHDALEGAALPAAGELHHWRCG